MLFNSGIFRLISKAGLLFGVLMLSLTVWADKTMLDVSDSWIREMPPGSPTLAAYMTVSNQGESVIVIKGVSSSVSELAELHETSMENDMMKMRKIPELVILPGQVIELKEGGMHLMLIQVTQEIREGDEVEIELELENHPPLTITVPVKKAS